MRAVLRLKAGVFEDLLTHLLPSNGQREEAAFLCVSSTHQEDTMVFDVQDAFKLSPEEFDHQAANYLELADETRARLIKRAHDLGASLVEWHSHPGPWPAAFSIADISGLAETVPHMWWRLPKRPYLAIVVARTGFDALLWLDSPHEPRALDAIFAGDRILRPTNLTLRDWS